MVERVQLMRAKGWRMPASTVKVDRSTKWGNPFVVGKTHPTIPNRTIESRREAWALYREFAHANEDLIATARSELRGKNLACWCPLPTEGEDDHCHASELLRIGND
ncbi:DUF4326 domain-containing protein (plasmid) [Pararobbsia alpina]|uniref:DUF4326 domain-containing protein n=1 Tax=Pararobbsia alpina TaxID=621374 RepID=UPI0039A581B3